jgi:hypothetical protein
MASPTLKRQAVILSSFILLITRRPAEFAGHCREDPGYCQQTRFVPAFPYELHPKRQTITIQFVWQHDGRMAGVIE